MLYCGFLHNVSSQIPLPLINLDVKVTIEDFVAGVKLLQTYRNDEENPIETIYRFSMDKSNTVSGFVAIIDGKRIEGICKRKEEALNNYDDAIASGHGAYFMVQNDRESLEVNVGNLPPKKEVTIEINYYVELQFEEGSLIFNSLNNPQVTETNPNIKSIKPKLAIHLEMSSKIRNITSSFPINFEFGNSESVANVTFADNADISKCPSVFDLAIKLVEPHKLCAKVQMDDKANRCCMVSLYPDLELKDDEEVLSEMIFVIDRSGSMSGTRIEQVRDCLQLFLRSLPEGTMFNIIGFGRTFTSLFKESVQYDDASLEIASNHISSMSADLGGTKLLPPLQDILSRPPQKRGVPRQIFLLTDGQVDNTDECIKITRDNAQTTRIFTFGIGTSASVDLVKGIASAAEGDYELVLDLDKDSINEKVLRQLKRAMKPAITDIKVSWNGGLQTATSAPNKMPPIFCGGRMVVYGFLDEKCTSGDVVIEAHTFSKKLEWSVHVDLNDASIITKGDIFHKLAAKKLIQDLEERRSSIHLKGETEVENEIVKISTRNGVLSKHTAFVAIEKRQEGIEGTMGVRNIGSVDRQINHLTSFIGRPKRGLAPAQSLTSTVRRSAHPSPQMIASIAARRTGSLRNGISSKPSSNSFLKEIIMSQKANGSWTLRNIENLSADYIENAFPQNIVKLNDESKTVWMTAVVIAYLLLLQNEKHNWEMIVDKARKWLKREETKLKLSSSIDWEAEATKFLSRNRK